MRVTEVCFGWCCPVGSPSTVIDISGSVAIFASELTWAYAEFSFEDFAERAGIVESPTEGYIRNRIF